MTTIAIPLWVLNLAAVMGSVFVYVLVGIIAARILKPILRWHQWHPSEATQICLVTLWLWPLMVPGLLAIWLVSLVSRVLSRLAGLE